MQPTPLEHARFRIIPRDSKKLVIFFSGSSTPDHVFRWWKEANRIDASAILVNNGPNEWYQRGIEGLGLSVDAVVDTFQKWAAHLGATKIYTVGTSMGGAGALLYGAKLNAKVLAFAAETRLDFPHGNVKRLMTKDFTPEYPDLRPIISESKGTFDLISGESEPVDLLSASLICDLPNVNVVTLKRVSHGPPNYLKVRKRLTPLIDAFISDQPQPPFEEEGNGAYLDGFSENLYAAYCADKEKRYSDAENYSRKALSIYPDSEFSIALLGKSIFMQGRAKEALPYIRDATRLHSRVENRHLYASCLLKAGRKNDAVTVFKKIIDKYPDYADGYAGLANIYASANSYKSALSLIKKAVKLEPNRSIFKKKMIEYQNSVSSH